MQPVNWPADTARAGSQDTPPCLPCADNHPPPTFLSREDLTPLAHTPLRKPTPYSSAGEATPRFGCSPWASTPLGPNRKMKSTRWPPPVLVGRGSAGPQAEGGAEEACSKRTTCTRVCVLVQWYPPFLVPCPESPSFVGGGIMPNSEQWIRTRRRQPLSPGPLSSQVSAPLPGDATLTHPPN